MDNSKISEEQLSMFNRSYLRDPEVLRDYIKRHLKEIPRDMDYWKNKLLKKIIKENYNLEKAYKNVYDSMVNEHLYEFYKSNPIDIISNSIYCNEKLILEETYNKLICSSALIEYCNKKYNEPVINNQLYYIGIYSLYCIKSKYSYIGQSIDMKGRFRSHKNKLNKNKHENKNLQKDWNIYGAENFTFNILEEVNCNIYDSNTNKSEEAWNILSFKEKHWINKIKRNYNIANPMNQVNYTNNVIGDNFNFSDYSDAEDIIKTILSKIPINKRNSFKKYAQVILQC